jgi:hypothetical protein
MCDYLKLKSKTWNFWNLYVKHLNLKIWKLKCLNLDVWILKVENYKLKFEIFLWNVWRELEILKIEMSKYWKLKTKMFKYWKLKIEMSEYWKLKIEMFE